jgi:UDP-N-acetylenolpyruvoylglucosamine reductase
MSKYNKSFRDRIAARRHSLGKQRGTLSTTLTEVAEEVAEEVVEEKPKKKAKKKAPKKKKTLGSLFKRGKKED